MLADLVLVGHELGAALVLACVEGPLEKRVLLQALAIKDEGLAPDVEVVDRDPWVSVSALVGLFAEGEVGGRVGSGRRLGCLEDGTEVEAAADDAGVKRVGVVDVKRHLLSVLVAPVLHVPVVLVHTLPLPTAYLRLSDALLDYGYRLDLDLD